LSIKKQHELTCPNCGQEQKITVWSAVNVTLDPAMRTKVFDGEINLFDCEECEHSSYVEVRFLYHDMDRKFAVHYFPKNSIKKIKFLEKFNESGLLKTEDEKLNFDVPDYMKKVHVVFDMNELVSYTVFREMLYDYQNDQLTR